MCRATHRVFFQAVLFLGCLALGVGRAWSAAPSLLVDLDPSGGGREAEKEISGPFFSLGRVALVPVEEASSGKELWVTDGTEGGTGPLVDLCAGDCSSQFIYLGRIGGVGIFSSWQRSVWRSDGTRSGTFSLTGDHPSQEACGKSAGSADALFFTFSTGRTCGLWKTDGTVAGTVQLTPESLDIDVDGIAVLGPHVFFWTSDLVDGIYTWPEIWRSDGTPAGTVRVLGGPDVILWGPLRTVGSRLFFEARTAQDLGLQLWTSDGTEAGTRPVTRFTTPYYPFAGPLQVIDGLVYFPADDGSGVELWRSDGTAAGTRRLTAFTAAKPFGEQLFNWKVEKIGGRLVFLADDDGTGLRWWTTDGRPGSTQPVHGCPEGCPTFEERFVPVRLGGKLFFAGHGDGSGTELWVTDGTASGTRMVRDLCRGACDTLLWSAVPLLNKVFFIAKMGDRNEVWATDGTPQGTHFLVGIGDPEPLTSAPVLGAEALLALPAERSNVMQLWKTDGTPEGTRQVQLLADNGRSSGAQDLVAAGSGVRFLVDTSVAFMVELWTSFGTAETTTSLEAPVAADHLTDLGGLALLSGSAQPLWRSDGTTDGTFQLTPDDLMPGRPVVLGSRAVFVADRRGSQSYELWTTDGSVGGTKKILDGGPSSSLVSLGPDALFELDSRLWITNGTAEGTRPLTPPDSFQFQEGQAARLGGVIYVRGYGYDRGEDDVWRTDGTTAGTYPLAEDLLEDPEGLIAHRNQLYILTDTELWRSDGTDSGTVLVKAESFYNASHERIQLTSFGNLLFFVATTSESGRELWRTDGTTAGTTIVRDIVPGSASSAPSGLTVLGDRLYFTAYDPEHGIELWETDGTAAGTRLVQDIAPGALSSAPQELTAAGGRLYFTADDGVHGREPWVYAPGGAACVPSDTVLCLGGGRFKVEADWRVEESSGRGHAVSLTADTGYFWFFDSANVEVILKVLNGQGVNGHEWVFYGALSNVEYVLTVTDTQTGAARRYFNPAGRLGSVGDTQAFGPLGAGVPGKITLGPAPVAGEALIAGRTAPATGSCTPGATRLCLNDGRFAVEARWKAQGQTGTGKAVPLAGGDTGYFWFFDASNVEVVLKVLDGRPLNGKFWVFYGALSDVEYTLTVTDTVTGQAKTYTNPSGRLASVADTGAF